MWRAGSWGSDYSLIPLFVVLQTQVLGSHVVCSVCHLGVIAGRCKSAACYPSV